MTSTVKSVEVFHKNLYVTTRKNTLLMAEILRSLRDGGELRLMNGDINPDGINLPRLRKNLLCHVME